MLRRRAEVDEIAVQLEGGQAIADGLRRLGGERADLAAKGLQRRPLVGGQLGEVVVDGRGGGLHRSLLAGTGLGRLAKRPADISLVYFAPYSAITSLRNAAPLSGRL